MTWIWITEVKIVCSSGFFDALIANFQTKVIQGERENKNRQNWRKRNKRSHRQWKPEAEVSGVHCRKSRPWYFNSQPLSKPCKSVYYLFPSDYVFLTVGFSRAITLSVFDSILKETIFVRRNTKVCESIFSWANKILWKLEYVPMETHERTTLCRICGIMQSSA